MRVIHNGIDAQQYAPDPDIDVLEQYGVDPNRPNVVFVGRITRQKGVPVLLRAAAQLDLLEHLDEVGVRRSLGLTAT